MVDALAAQGSTKEIHILNSVILLVSIASAFGAAWMIISFCLFKAVRTFRHQLVLGLAISDLLTSINFMISSAVNLSGHSIGAPAQKNFCSFNGFATQWFVIQTDYWILIIAICTFLLLGDYRKASDWVQKHRLILWSIPWAVSGLWAAIGLGVVGYGNIGAWCWFTSDKTRLLVNFLPRWIIITLILLIYFRLSYVLYRTHSRFSSLDLEHGHNSLTHNNHDPKPNTVEIITTPDRAFAKLDHSAYSSEEDDDLTAPSPVVRPGPHPSPPPSCYTPCGKLRRFPSILSLSNIKLRHHAPCALHEPPIQAQRSVLKTLSYQMLTYPLVYMMIWMLPTACRIYQVLTGKAVPFDVGLLDKLCVVLQGVVDAAVYGWSERMGMAWGSWLGVREDRGERGWR